MTRPNNDTRNRVTISFPSDIEYSMIRELAEVSGSQITHIVCMAISVYLRENYAKDFSYYTQGQHISTSPRQPSTGITR